MGRSDVAARAPAGPVTTPGRHAREPGRTFARVAGGPFGAGAAAAGFLTTEVWTARGYCDLGHALRDRPHEPRRRGRSTSLARRRGHRSGSPSRAPRAQGKLQQLRATLDAKRRDATLAADGEAQVGEALAGLRPMADLLRDPAVPLERRREILRRFLPVVAGVRPIRV